MNTTTTTTKEAAVLKAFDIKARNAAETAAADLANYAAQAAVSPTDSYVILNLVRAGFENEIWTSITRNAEKTGRTMAEQARETAKELRRQALWAATLAENEAGTAATAMVAKSRLGAYARFAAEWSPLADD